MAQYGTVWHSMAPCCRSSLRRPSVVPRSSLGTGPLIRAACWRHRSARPSWQRRGPTSQAAPARRTRAREAKALVGWDWLRLVECRLRRFQMGSCHGILQGGYRCIDGFPLLFTCPWPSPSGSSSFSREFNSSQTDPVLQFPCLLRYPGLYECWGQFVRVVFA